MRSTLRAIWLLGPDPFSDAAEHPPGHFGYWFLTPFFKLRSTLRAFRLLVPAPISAHIRRLVPAPFSDLLAQLGSHQLQLLE